MMIIFLLIEFINTIIDTYYFFQNMSIVDLLRHCIREKMLGNVIKHAHMPYVMVVINYYGKADGKITVSKASTS